MYSTRQIVRREKHGFYLLQNICKLPTLISSFFQLCHIIYCSNSAFPWISDFKRPKLSSPCDKSIFLKVYLFKHVYELLLSIWSVLLEYLHHFYIVMFYWIFLDVCFCLFLFVVLLLLWCCFCSLLFRFYFWPKF